MLTSLLSPWGQGSTSTKGSRTTVLLLIQDDKAGRE